MNVYIDVCICVVNTGTAVGLVKVKTGVLEAGELLATVNS